MHTNFFLKVCSLQDDFLWYPWQDSQGEVCEEETS
jgi:hypothetical protein